jgi:NTE family protein
MSGGGAKGMVHLGVIKALEENQIPIDYITGTSIGAMVGGMYACGYSVDEIVDYFKSQQFERGTSGDYSHEVPSFYKRLLDDAEILSARFHLYFRQPSSLTLPTNLVPPYEMDFILIGVYAAAAAASGNDLNALMLPFRALSTNAYDKKPYAPRYGDIGRLVRASMSFPGLYKPTLIDSMLLFDGGLIDNFPIDVMQQEFAPNFVIGSNCSYNYQRPTEDDVLSHVYALVSAASRYEIPDSGGWMINFDSIDTDLLDFTQVDALVAQGYRYAMRLMPKIKQQVERRRPQTALDSMRSSFKAKMPPLRFKNINVSGGSPRLQKYAHTRMTRYADTLISPAALRFRYFDAVSDDALTTFVPQPVYSPQDSAFNLHLRISPAPNFKLGIGGYFSSAAHQLFGSIGYNYHAAISLRAYANVYFGTIYGSQKALLRADFRTKRHDIPLFIELGETYNYFDYYSKNPELAFFDTRPDFLHEGDIFGYLHIGTGSPVLGAAIRLGVNAGRRNTQYYPTTDFSSADIPEEMRFDFVSGKFSIENNTLNFKTNPTEGLREYLSVQYIAGTEYHTYGSMSDSTKYDKKRSALLTERIGRHRIFRAKGLWTQYFQLGKYFSLGYYAEGAYSTLVYLKDYYANLLMLPAFEPLQHTNGLFLENFRSSVYLAGGVIPTYVAAFLSPNLLLRSEFYVFLPFSQLSIDNQYAKMTPSYRANIRNFYFIGSVSAIYQLPLGNISVSMSYYERSKTVLNSIFWSIGYGYYLKNGRAFD